MKNLLEIVQMDFENPQHIQAIDQLGEWTGKPGEVLLLDRERIASHPHKFLAFDTAGGMLAGYIAITTEYMPQCVQLGGFVVNPEMSNMGIGTKLASHLLGSIPQLMPEAELVTAFVNKKTKRMFQKLGAKAVSNRTVYWYMAELNLTNLKEKNNE